MTTRELTGQTFGELTVLERDGRSQHMAAWLCECTCGALVTKRGTYLTSGTTKTCGNQKIHRNPAAGTTPTNYYIAHKRLRDTYGPARDYLCPCGQQAKVWSFLGCEEALIGPGGTNPYCEHACPDEYQPQCVPCARLTDLLVRSEISA